MSATSHSLEAAASPVGVEVHDYREPVPDLGVCPLGLGHRRGDPGCQAFRRAAHAKRYQPPRSGWGCAQEAPGS